MKFLSWGNGGYESVHNYAGVLIPLEEAHLHSHSARIGRTEFEEIPDSAASADAFELESEAAKDMDNESTGMLQMSAAEYTMDGLRRETRRGGGRAGHTEYECE